MVGGRRAAPAGQLGALAAPLGHPGFRRLLGTHALLLLGEFVQLAALAGLTLTLSPHTSAWAGVLLAQAIPQGLFMPLGGMAVDRRGPRAVLLAAATTECLAAALLALLAGRGVALWQLRVYAGLVGASVGASLPALAAAVPAALPATEVQAGNALVQVAENGARLGGPLAAAALSALGRPAALAAAALSWGMGGVTAHGLELGAGQSAPGRPAGGTGWRELVADPVLVAVIPAVTLFALGYAAAANVGLAALATLVFGAGARGPGILQGAFGGGALLGAVLVGGAPRPRRSGVAAGATAVAAGICLAMAARSPSLVAAVPWTTLSGAAFTACLVLVLTIVQLRTPGAARGRILALFTFGFFGLYPLAYALTLWAGRALSPRGTVAAGAVLMAAGGVLALSRRTLRAALPTQPAQ